MALSPDTAPRLETIGGDTWFSQAPSPRASPGIPSTACKAVLRCRRSSARPLTSSNMIDSHCHLTDPRLAEQIDAVLLRAATAGVRRMITIGTDIDDAIKCLELCRAVPNVRCAIG